MEAQNCDHILKKAVIDHELYRFYWFLFFPDKGF